MDLKYLEVKILTDTQTYYGKDIYLSKVKLNVKWS